MGRLRSVSGARRSVGVVGIVGVSVASLTACSMVGGPGANRPVGFDGVQSATIQIEAQGTFVSPEDGQRAEQAGRGSGFIIDPSGLAVTNNHVVVGAGTLKVWVGGDTQNTLSAQVVASSECLDLAVIKISAEDLPFMAWYEGPITAAQDVYAAGFPLGDPVFTMTRGIVSKADTVGQTEWASIDHIIEHDARIRGGNSGGPLVDKDGRVVGVNYAGDDTNDINLAISRQEVLGALKDLEAGKDVLSLGVNGQALWPADDGSAQGIWVNSKKSGSPADKAGIEPGDIIVEMEGVTLAAEGSLKEYCDVLRTHGTDSVIAVEVFRPSDDSYYRGQFNGDPLTPITVPSMPSGDGPGHDPSGEDESFTTISDGTGILSIDVPTAWRDVQDNEGTRADGSPLYQLGASPDFDAYQAGWSTPGVTLSATADTSRSLDDEFAMYDQATTACVLDDSDVYSDGRYEVEYRYWTECDGLADFVVVAATSLDGGHRIVLESILVPGQYPAALDRIITSFSVN